MIVQSRTPVPPSLVERMANVTDLNAALWPLQLAAGIEAGDVAGAFFCDDQRNEEAWRLASVHRRARWLREYLAIESRAGSGAVERATRNA